MGICRLGGKSIMEKENKELGKDIGVDIKLQHESIFNSMHRI